MSFNLKRKKQASDLDWIDGVSDMGYISRIKKTVDMRELDEIENFLNSQQNFDPNLREAIEAQKTQLRLQNENVGRTGLNPEQISNMNPYASSKKPFNLKKKAQEAEMPMDPMGLGDSPELMGDELEMRDETFSDPNLYETVKFKSHIELKEWLDNTDSQEVYRVLTENNAQDAKDAAEHYYFLKSDSSRASEEDVAEFSLEMWKMLPDNMKDEGGEVMGTPSVLSEIVEINKKIAQEKITEKKENKFNLKTAQHKTIDNMLMWGPSQTRKVDPFLRQPVSDWHIIERNKGFGLVVDDVWNIDYETIWRENIMDKYSRPYRDKDGNWVGGYIQKRFEVDKSIPETSNYQLKPGEKRKPVLPEYGNTESRLQAARSEGKIEGALDTSKPFNWKEASSKKKR